MLVYEFMIPAANVIKVTPGETIGDALEKILENGISAVVVCQDKNATGIITKTDIAKAYKQGLSLDTPATNIMSQDIITVHRSLPRDKAASVFAEHKIHHAVVVDNQGEFVGFISAWDCAKEGSLDYQAWPWNRRMMGRRI